MAPQRCSSWALIKASWPKALMPSAGRSPHKAIYNIASTLNPHGLYRRLDQLVHSRLFKETSSGPLEASRGA